MAPISSGRLVKTLYIGTCVLCVVMIYVIHQRTTSVHTTLITAPSSGKEWDQMKQQILQQLHNTSRRLAKTPNEVNLEEYEKQLSAHASADKVIFLALVDTSFMDMALNFYETSLERFRINNYLFIASDVDACVTLINRGIFCYVYMADKNAARSTIFRTKAFNIKMKIRTYMILDALKLGYTVVHTDADIYYVMNPLDDIVCSGSCHLAALWDDSAYNAGFVYVRPTTTGIAVYEHMKQTALTSDMDDQHALNVAMRHVNARTHYQRLDIQKYQCGVKYFEKDVVRYFADSKPCDRCVVIHNNWIVSLEAKRYRFQEMLMWMYDDNGYYSNPGARYITYVNHRGSSRDEQLESLKTALYIGHVLNRTIIIPRMQCKKTECPLNNYIRLLDFDTSAGFYYNYRESSFLAHPKVPKVVKNNVSSDIFWINTDRGRTFLHGEPPNNTKVLEPEISRLSASIDEFGKWFGDVTTSVLRFGPVIGAFGSQPFPATDKDFATRVKRGFKKSTYRQL